MAGVFGPIGVDNELNPLPPPPLRYNDAIPDVHKEQTGRYDNIVHDIDGQIPGCPAIKIALEGVACQDDPGNTLFDKFRGLHISSNLYVSHQRLIQVLDVLVGVADYVEHGDVAAFRDYHNNERHDADARFPFEGPVPPLPAPPAVVAALQQYMAAPLAADDDIGAAPMDLG